MHEFTRANGTQQSMKIMVAKTSFLRWTESKTFYMTSPCTSNSWRHKDWNLQHRTLFPVCFSSIVTISGFALLLTSCDKKSSALVWRVCVWRPVFCVEEKLSQMLLEILKLILPHLNFSSSSPSSMFSGPFIFVTQVYKFHVSYSCISTYSLTIVIG